jgi:hypothetical protein
MCVLPVISWMVLGDWMGIGEGLELEDENAHVEMMGGAHVEMTGDAHIEAGGCAPVEV